MSDARCLHALADQELPQFNQGLLTGESPVPVRRPSTDGKIGRRPSPNGVNGAAPSPNGKNGSRAPSPNG
jgi:hypothetical protein